MKKQQLINVFTLFLASLLFTMQLSAQELFTDANAASPTQENNTDTGWAHDGFLDAVTEEVQNGTFSLRLLANGDGWYKARYLFDVEIGKQYTIKIWAKRPTTNNRNPGFLLWTGFESFTPMDITHTTWHEYEWTLTANATTAEIKIYAGRPTAGDTTDKKIYFDNISIMGPDGPVGGSSVWTQSGNDISYDNGNVGIGTTTPDELLTVDGRIHAEEVKVSVSVPAPDYVFKENYELRSLKEVQGYIEEHGHLPNIPSAAEIESKGIDLGSMEMKLLEKIEELTLYILMQEEKLSRQDARIRKLENASRKK